MNKKMNGTGTKQHLSFNSRMESSPSEVFLKILRSCFELMISMNNDREITSFLENFHPKTYKLILKSNSRITITGSWIRSRKLSQLSTWQKIKFVVFLSRRCQNVENVHETFLNTKIPFQKRTFYDHRVQNLPKSFFRNLATSVGLKHDKTSALIRHEENKV